MPKKENEINEKKFQQAEENAGQAPPPIDPFYDPDVPEGGDLHPPQDLNLKLQSEKENSIALTRLLQQLQADFDNFRKRNSKLEEDSYRKGVVDSVKVLLLSYDAVVSEIGRAHV